MVLKNYISKFILVSTLVFGLFSSSIVTAAPEAGTNPTPQNAQQQAPLTLKQKIKKQNNALSGEKGAGLGEAKDPREIVASIVKSVLGLVGTILVVYIVYGGFLIMTAAGESDKVSKGKSILINGVIGLAIILSAYAVTTFVTKALLNATGVGGAPTQNGPLPTPAGPSQGYYGN